MTYRNDLPRIYELRDALPNPVPPKAYFHDLDNTLAACPLKLKQFRDIEHDLQGLDATAWSYLKTELIPLLTARHPTRGWQALFDKINQAKAYNYLVSVGYSGVRFIPESKVKRQRTPDLQASEQGGCDVLCEVKTINVSMDEANRSHEGGVGETTDRLPPAYFSKLACAVAEAKAQMEAYSKDRTAKRLAYIIVNFDDRTHEYVDRYKFQIDQFMTYIAPHGVEIRFDIKEAFYSSRA